MAKIIELILSNKIRGKGTKDDVVRQVNQLFTKDGDLVAEEDPCNKKLNIMNLGAIKNE